MFDILLQGLQTLVSLFILLSFVYPCINIVKYVTTEKEKQLKEAMKIMGLGKFTWLNFVKFHKLSDFPHRLLASLDCLVRQVLHLHGNHSHFDGDTFESPMVRRRESQLGLHLLVANNPLGVFVDLQLRDNNVLFHVERLLLKSEHCRGDCRTCLVSNVLTIHFYSATVRYHFVGHKNITVPFLKHGNGSWIQCRK